MLDSLEPVITLNRFSINQEMIFELNEKNPWLQNILDELEEQLDEEDRIEKPAIRVQLRLLRKHDTLLKDHFIVRAECTGHYTASCIRCLIPIQQKIEATFSCCFLHPSMEKLPEFSDIDEVYCDQEEMGLHFHDKGKVSLEELLHEYIFLNVDPFPLHDENCKGLCPVCGANLNNYRCAHERNKK